VVPSRRLALSEGEPLVGPIPATLPQLLERAAERWAEHGVTYVAADGSERHHSYPALLAEARRLASGLSEAGIRPGERVILQLADHRDFIAGFWGCVLGGCVPVPIATPAAYDPATSAAQKLQKAWHLLGRPVVLSVASRRADVARLGELLQLDGLRVVSLEELRASEDHGISHRAEPADAAFIMTNTRNCHGFYGASSMERLPVERALTEQVRQFKAIGAREAPVTGG
jgi:acyl-CoA synthetase (AMP-forming)/AMP-acid ligase II